MHARWSARRLAPLPLLIAALLVPAGEGAGAPALTISGSDQDVWNQARPTPSYRITGKAGATIAWRLSGTNRTGTGRSPLRVTLSGLATGTYTLRAEQAEPRATATRKVVVDVTPPGVTIRRPPAGAAYDLGEAVEVDFSCSGAVACNGSTPDGAPLPTGAPGPATLTVMAVDQAGNRTTRQIAYQVAAGAPVITARPAGPVRGARPVFAWTGVPNATFTWQVLSGGAVISQGDTPDTSVALGPLVPGAYAFQVRQATGSRVSPWSVADPFVVAEGVRASTLLRPATRNARALRPRAGRALAARRPLLTWRAAGGADLYNVQVFRVTATGMTKVKSLFPTGTRTRVAGLKWGERYAWRVWPFARGRGYTARPLGLSWFELRRPVRLTPAQMATDRRIALSALRRAGAIQAWLDAGIVAGDLRHEGLGAAAFDAGLAPAGPPEAGGTAAASVRPIELGTAPRTRARVPVTAAELQRTRRIARAALAQVAAIEARLAAGLTGGDIVDGSIGAEKLAPGVTLGRRRATTQPHPPSVTPPVAATPVPRVRVTVPRVRDTQRIAQAAVRRAEALRLRLLQGLSTSDFAPGSIGSADLSAGLRR